MWASAAVVDGDEVVSEVREVDMVGSGGGMCMATNMWYVWMAARMKRQDRGITGSPSRLVKFGSAKAYTMLEHVVSRIEGNCLHWNSSPWPVHQRTCYTPQACTD